MATPEIPYTIPKLVKGKRITTVPMGSTWSKGWNGIGNYKFLSVTLLVIMAVLYYIFK